MDKVDSHQKLVFQSVSKIKILLKINSPPPYKPRYVYLSMFNSATVTCNMCSCFKDTHICTVLYTSYNVQYTYI